MHESLSPSVPDISRSSSPAVGEGVADAVVFTGELIGNIIDHTGERTRVVVVGFEVGVS